MKKLKIEITGAPEGHIPKILDVIAKVNDHVQGIDVSYCYGEEPVPIPPITESSTFSHYISNVTPEGRN